MKNKNIKQLKRGSKNESPEHNAKLMELNQSVFNYFFKLSGDDLIKLDKISLSIGLNRGINPRYYKKIHSFKSEWSLVPLMFHEYKHGELALVHIRCQIHCSNPNFTEFILIDVPLNFCDLIPSIVSYRRNGGVK